MPMQTGSLLRYGLAAATALFALLLTVLFHPFLDRTLFLLFFAAVVVTVWFWGMGPALFTIGLSAAACWYLLSHPLSPPVPDPSHDLVRLFLFVVASFLISAMIMFRKQAETLTRPARDRPPELTRYGTIKTRLVVAFLLATLLVSSMLLASYRGIGEFRDSSRLVTHTQEVMVELETILSALQDVETGERGYVITGDERFLKPRLAGTARISQRLERVRKLIADNPQQQARLTRLESYLTQQIAVVERVIRARKTKGYEAAQKLVQAGEEKTKMDQIHQLIAEMMQEERARLTTRTARFEDRARATLTLITLGSLLTLIIVVLSALTAARQLGERGDAEARLRASEERYRNIFQTAAVSIWEEDFSQVKAALDGLRASGVRDLRAYLAEHPEFVGQAISLVKIVDVNDRTLTLFGASSKQELLVSLHRIFLPETQQAFVDELLALDAGLPAFESETVLQTLQGDRRTVAFSIAFPTPPTPFDRVLVSILDITERKRALEAREKLEAELTHTARMLTMGELAASIAHEVNQPLAAIATNSRTCLRWLASPSPDLAQLREAVEDITADATRASEVILHIRRLMKKSPPQKDALNMNDVIREVLALAASGMAERRISVRTDLMPSLPVVPGDRVLLQQVLLNLILNGTEAMSEETLATRELLIGSRAQDSATIVVSVRDTGVGLDPQRMARMFDPFFTTKAGGMGLGLSISRSIVEAHGGKLWVLPNSGRGTTFHFSLPVA